MAQENIRLLSRIKHQVVLSSVKCFETSGRDRSAITGRGQAKFYKVSGRRLECVLNLNDRR